MDEKYVNSSVNEQTNCFSIANLIEIILQIWIQTCRRLINTEWCLFSGLNRFKVVNIISLSMEIYLHEATTISALYVCQIH